MTEKQSGVAAVERALAILNSFRPGDGSLSLHDIAERTGLYKSTILRLIVTLTQSHCIQRLDDGRYQLGSMLLHWGSMYQSSLRLDDHVLPVLRKLVDQTLEGASFFTREDNVRVCLFRVDSPRMLRDHVRAGDLLPLDKGAAGRVLCTFDRQLQPAGKMPTSPLVVTIGEREAEIAAVAAPVFGAGGSLRGALAVSGPSTRFDALAIQKISDAVYEAAVDLTRRLGGHPGMLPPYGGPPETNRSSR
ncbi:IclR family transcriptional regulator [Lacisediminimonas sp.]|uniref:IclR family transcriptional regulator n=1 Tax=Lacisediminimonas sp. TaxID=3060582 RepID=UPI00271DBD56|nr:IclR family transcriptional regulator [Lacisediminimonas sp.]MDO8299718.1 IclR family transcriptional regulator [Lacisediminimonas sp.]